MATVPKGSPSPLRLEKVLSYGRLLLQGASRSTWQIGGLSKCGNVLPSFVGQQERQLGAGL